MKERNETHDSEYNNEAIDSKNFDEYSILLGDYLAKKLGSILHIDMEYNLQSVNIRNESFKAENGKIIRFSESHK